MSRGNALAFARSKGWTVRDEFIFTDDAVSGAEVRKLVNRQRLLDVIASGRAPFQVLILRDTSRFSRRDGDEVVGQLKAISERGIQVWFYSSSSRFEYGTLATNITGYNSAEMAAEYRRQVAALTKEALLRKAKQGFVTGGRCYGYDNLRVDGHTERRINEAEAAVIRRIFTLCSQGVGYTKIAKLLNAEGAPAPQPRRGQPVGWGPSSINEILHRRRYIGELVYNQSRRREPDGPRCFATRPESEWIAVQRPELRIIPEPLWTAVRSRLDGIRASLLQASGGRLGRRRHDSTSKYLLTNFLRCAACGGSVSALNRSNRKVVYGCIAHHKRGQKACSNNLVAPVETLNADVLAKLQGQVLREKVVKAIIDGLVALHEPATRARDLQRSRTELHTLGQEISRLTTAVAQGGNLPELLEALQTRQARRQELTTVIHAHEGIEDFVINRRRIDEEMRQVLRDCRSQLTGDLDGMREALRRILKGPVVLTPQEGAYEFEGDTVLDALIVGHIPALQPLWRARQDLNL